VNPEIVRHTNCGRKHRTWKGVAACIWPRTQIWGANGSYATLAPCQELTIELHLDLASAELTFGALKAGCGSQCSQRRHRLVQIEAFSAPKADELPPWCGECDGPTLSERWVFIADDTPGYVRGGALRCPRCNPYAKGGRRV
jgi:hypothetical protein